MRTILLIFVSLVFVVSCRKNKVPEGTPKCMRKSIVDMEKSPNVPAGAKIEEYWFQGKSVYVLYDGTEGADMSYPVNDGECNHLGDLAGLAGNTQISGEDFSHAVFIKILWQKK